MDAPQAAAVAATDMIEVLQPGGLALASLGQITADPMAQITVLASALAALTTRVTALETKPEEAAHFTASAAIPALSVLGGGSVTLTGLVPARAGDVLRTYLVRASMQSFAPGEAAWQ